MKKIITILFSLALFILVGNWSTARADLQAIATPQQPTTHRDKYQTNLFTGSSTYSYPITVPKGTNNLTPEVSLSYDNQAAHSPSSSIGSGWEVSKDYIQRIDNFTPADTSDDKFQLHFKGVTYDLVYNPVDSLFHTKIESFLKVQQFLNGGQGITGMYWQVTTTDGTVYRFGYALNSELLCNGQNYDGYWNVDQITDTHNNHIYYTYVQSSGVAYLTQIQYNTEKAREVDFNYVSNPYQFQTYQQGCNMIDSSRLSSIQVKANGNLVHEYDVAFNQAANGQSLLNTITEKGSDGSSLPPTSFSYNSEPTNWNTTRETWVNGQFTCGGSVVDPSQSNTRIIDVNGDGLPDIVFSKSIGSGQEEYCVFKNTGSSWNPTPEVWVNGQFNGGGISPDLANSNTKLMDVNNDGLPDIVMSNGNANGETYYVFKNTGSSWNPTPEVWVNGQFTCDGTGADLGQNNTRLLDVNGDGLPDVVFSKTKTDGYEEYCVFKNTGRSWNPTPEFWVNGQFTGGGTAADITQTNMTFADVNGDGLPDIVLGFFNGNGESYYVFKNTGSSWNPTPEVWVNGQFTCDGTGADPSQRNIRIIDVNGDGLPDIVLSKGIAPGQEEYCVFKNTGSSWNPTPEVWVKGLMTDGNGNTPDLSQSNTQLIDANGDGLPDVMFAINGGTNESLYIFKNNGYAPDTLSTITTEQGGTVHFDYSASTKYSNGSNLPFPLWVVNKETLNNGLNNSQGTNDVTTYNYQNGAYNFPSREFRGFGQVNEIDPNGAQKQYIYNQDDALKGLLSSVTTNDSSGNPYAKTENTWTNTLNNSINTVLLSKEKNYTYDGVLANPKITETDYQYDMYGNPTKISELGDTSMTGDKRFTYNEYIYNPTLWIVNTRSHTYRNAADDSTKVSEQWNFYDNDASAIPTPTPTPGAGNSTATVKVLTVGGGGAGGGSGTNLAGGGGAGRVVYDSSHTITATPYIITVGAGGTGISNDRGNNGGNSSFDTITANGGGGGGAGAGQNSNGKDGGSGGGAGWHSGSPSGGNAVNGNTGGGVSSGNNGAGFGPGTGGEGGGGAGAPSTSASTGAGTDGGVGIANSISGSSVFYGGGGGGGGDNGAAGGNGGNGGGGNGGAYPATSGTAGAANTGGGGGAYAFNGIGAGYNGGSGIVVISAPIGILTATGGTHTQSGGNDIWTFTSSGIWTPTLIPTSTPTPTPTPVPASGFGDGRDGDATISSNTVESPIDSSVNAAAGTTTATVGSGLGFLPNQIVLLHQTQGTNAGTWEFARVQSYTGTTVTLTASLTNSYSNTGGNQAQIRVVPQYHNVTINAGVTWSAKPWNGTTGGILAFLASGTVSGSGNIVADGLGFRGGRGVGSSTDGIQGESQIGIGNTNTASNGEAGGGGSSGNAAGGGGGYATNGATGNRQGGTAGVGGGTAGINNLTNMLFGGAGGSGCNNQPNGGFSGLGGNGGGIIFATVAAYSLTGNMSTNGGNGGNVSGGDLSAGGGGGGAGGSILLKVGTASLGSSLITANSGTGGSTGPGGNGGVGRIHADYITSLVGTTNPTLDSSQVQSITLPAPAAAVIVIPSTLTKGDLTRQIKWNNTGSTNPTTTYMYDSFGNQIKVTDANNHTTQYVYGITDSTNTYPEKIINAKNQPTTFSYNLGTGNVLSKTDPNGNTTTYTYDTFGRITGEIAPYDNVLLPTTVYQYFDTTVPQGKLIAKRTSGTNTLNTYTFTDGLDRTIQTRSDAQDTSKQIVTDVFYNPIGLVSSQTIPHLDTLSTTYVTPVTGSKTITSTYDILGRLLTITNPDLTQKKTSYDHWTKTVTDENNHTINQILNAYGKIIEVDENTGISTPYTTLYAYDSSDQLTKITDALNNTTTFTYDSLGNKITQVDPDLGTWHYTYDSVGNLLTQADNRAMTITKTYDELDRLLKTHYPTDADVTYTYDSPTIGTLSSKTDHAGVVNYTYDQRFRKTDESRVADGMTWDTKYSYDSTDRLTSQTNPDGEVVTYTYNPQGQVNTVSGVINGIIYNPQGNVTSKTYANSLSTVYTYDPNSFRLNNIKTGNLQDITYTYDAVGNVTSTKDNTTNTTQSFSYDPLNRLTTANQGGVYSYTYTYDPIGNLLQFTNGINTIAYNYGQQAGVHALTNTFTK